jgi:hypothetical protein
VSVLIIAKFPGDTAVFNKVLVERSDYLAKLGNEARAVGAIHHRFGVGDGYVVVVDEWETAEQFERYIGKPELQAIIAEMGASGAPDVIVAEAVSSSDEF